MFHRLASSSSVRSLQARARRFMASQADGFDRVVGVPGGWGDLAEVGAIGAEATPRPPTADAVLCEIRFMNLHAQARFEDMWDMLAEDAQRAWGGLHNFVRDMPRLDAWLEILDMQVGGVTVLDSWTDEVHQRTYRNVARLVMRYRVRQRWREWAFDREVHLVPARDGWRTLCYPTRVRAAVGR